MCSMFVLGCFGGEFKDTLIEDAKVKVSEALWTVAELRSREPLGEVTFRKSTEVDR